MSRLWTPAERSDPLPRNPVGAAHQSQLDEGLTKLARINDDREVRRRLGNRREMVLDVNDGEPVNHHAYRLDCGHIISVWLVPLPDDTTETFCGEDECRQTRRVVEHLTD